MDFKKVVAKHLKAKLNTGLTEQQLFDLLETPKHPGNGDIAFPCFTLAKMQKDSPVLIAANLEPQLAGSQFEKVRATGPYLNFFLNKQKVSQEVLTSILEQASGFGDHSFGLGKKVPIDMSSPNIAKPFSMGHLRSTVIGNSIANILRKCGFDVIRINHLGDWGTQFGKLITAYKAWGSKTSVRENPIRELFALYIKFHQQAELNPSLEEQGRAWFKKLEAGDEEALYLWKWFRDESLKEFNKIYALLDVSFDSYKGEAFYNDKMAEVVDIIEKAGLLEEDGGAMVVKLDEHGLPPSLIRKTDGATLYVTRDLAASIFRYRTYKFDKTIYVVGNEQSLHFRQLKMVLSKLGYSWADDLIHLPFGMILKDGKKMSTRKGKVVLLEEVLEQSISLANKNITEKNPHLDNKEQIAREVGVGAVIFHDLRNDRMNNIEFSLEEMLKFEGETGPYLQYTHARACSLLFKSRVLLETGQLYRLDDQHSWAVIKRLAVFPHAIEKAYTLLEPSVIAKYLIELAKAFNSFYGNVRILEENNALVSRLALVQATAIVLKEGLRLLGIKAPEQM
ncbi:arginine--tRNA ligase [Peribacillus sp. SCS-155]|uniref:arginine--tRNA ligase n=1 Tax=Peribacillus sedimenti TaxID=3115297 RepID=UPI003905FE44